MKRLSAFIILAALMLCVITFTSFSADLNEIVIFLDSDAGRPVNEFKNSKSICSEISFLADRDCEAYVVTVAYSDKNEKLIEGEPLIEKLKLTKGEEVNYTTKAIDVTSASKVKVFVWEGFLNLKPIFNKPAILEKEATQEGWISKFVEAESNTSGNYTVLKDSELTAGELFEAAAGVNISDKYTDVIIETTEGTAVGEFIKNTSDWTAGVVKFAGEGTLKLTIQDYAECAPCEMYVDVINPFDRYEKVFENTDTYIYRAGNENTVKLLSLFETKAMEPAPVDLSVSINNLKGNAGGSFDAANNTIQFTGTGVVEVTISDKYSNPESLMLEIVNAKNVTTYGELSNEDCVLLNDITMTSGRNFYMSNATLYGNGFTFDVTNGKTGDTSNGSVSNNYVISLNNSAIDNVKLVGAVYTTYGANSKDNYNYPLILSSGNNIITNSYISNCASPIRVKDGNLEVVNTTLKGGNFANMDIRGGHITLEDVTTINQVDGNDTASDGTVVVGLGIVFYYENVLETAAVDIKGYLKQYNHLSESDKDNYIKDSSAKILVNAMFGYDDAVSDDGWVNTGIISMASTVGDSNISDVDGYIGIDVSLAGNYGFAYVPAPTAPVSAPLYASSMQTAIAPSYAFDYTSKNYIAKTDGSNDYCYYENGKVNISMDDGDTLNWDTSILSVAKEGMPLDYTVAMNGTDYTGKEIPFSISGDYDVTYTYTDNNNYDVDENGNLVNYAKKYTKTVKISVSVIKAQTKKAEFTFGSSNQATEKLTIGNNTYISATGVSHDNTTWSYITVSGEKVFYPIVEATITGSSQNTKAYFNVFKNVVTITDYADGGTGAAIIYNSSTTTMPSGLTVEKGKYGEFTNISSNWSTLNDSSLTMTGASNVFKYAAGSTASSTPVTYSNALCFASPGNLKARAEYYTIAQYSYTDATNNTYYYYVGYHMADQTSGSSGGSNPCVTPDTLVTLADGTEKEIQYLSGDEELLVWNHNTGMMDTAPVAYIVDHDKKETKHEIIHLFFDDGKDIQIIGEHVFFDITLNKYVALDENAYNYIGDEFAVRYNDGLTSAKLVSVEKKTQNTSTYEVVTYEHMTCFTNGILSASAFLDGLLNSFEINPETYSYDVEKMKYDIETYGLYTYDDFKELIPEAAFEMYNAKYLKPAVSKGLLSWEDIYYLIDIYNSLGIIPLF